MIKPALYTGKITHQRHLPVAHGFSYPLFMYYFNLDKLEQIPDMGSWFSTRKWALSRFLRSDYFGAPTDTLSCAIKKRMAEITKVEVEGVVCGLLNLRTFGLYFSPVNFYYGFNRKQRLTHFLAEVSNIPWNERHQYAHYLDDGNLTFSSKKKFKVSPFNPLQQHYQWLISPPQEQLRVQLDVSDQRGCIFNAALKLERQPLRLDLLKKQLLRKPVMTASIVARIYWQALQLYRKGVPYIPYNKEIT